MIHVTDTCIQVALTIEVYILTALEHGSLRNKKLKLQDVFSISVIFVGLIMWIFVLWTKDIS